MTITVNKKVISCRSCPHISRATRKNNIFPEIGAGVAAGLLYSPAKLKRPLFYSNKKFCYNIFIRKRNFLNLKERGDCMFDDNGFSYQFAEFLRKAGDVNLSYTFQKEMMNQQLYKQLEHEQIVHEVTEEVLSRLNTTVDTQEIFNKIDGLNDKIDSLERK